MADHYHVDNIVADGHENAEKNFFLKYLTRSAIDIFYLLGS